MARCIDRLPRYDSLLFHAAHERRFLWLDLTNQLRQVRTLARKKSRLNHISKPKQNAMQPPSEPSHFSLGGFILSICSKTASRTAATQAGAATKLEGFGFSINYPIASQ